jgi:biopolymer transport protein ExbD
MAPLIDVVFQQLIFFMLTSSFVFQPGIKVNLPKAVTSEIAQEESIVVTITAENVIYLGDRVSTPKELETKLKGLPSGKSLLIKADRKASLGRVVEVWDMCRTAGIVQVNIATTELEI